MEQACATGLQATVLGATEVQSGASDVVAVVTFEPADDWFMMLDAVAKEVSSRLLQDQVS